MVALSLRGDALAWAESIGRASQSLTRDRDASMWNAGDLSFLRVAREVPAIAVRAAVYREPMSPVFLAGNQAASASGRLA